MDRKRADAAGMDSAKSSPVRAQWEALKRQHPGRVLLFQLGDFYETFESDARIVARVCDITLTSRELSKGDRVPLAGVPIHRAAPHIGKLIAAGYHVAICDQVSEAGKGLVERQVTRIVTPGTVAEPGLVSPHENNLLVALAWGRSGVGLAAADVTTGEVMTTVVEVYVLDADDQPGAALLAAELQRLAPAECLVAESALFPIPLPGHVTPLPPARFDAGAASDAVRRLFGVSSLDGFGLAADSPALAALGALIGFVGEANYRLLASLREPRPYIVGSHVALDPATRRNLELTRTARHGHVRGSLFHAIDRTRTPMGARRLRRLLGQPMMDRGTLDRRLDAVEALVADGERRRTMRPILGRLGDVERLVGRVRQMTASSREVMMLATALRVLPEVQQALSEEHGLLGELGAAIDGCPGLVEAIEGALADLGGPRLIRPGYSAELDELVDGMGESRKWLAQLERRERERTGIRSLKVGYNKVFGYYLEVTRPNLPSVPSDYQRRQSLVSAERFVTPELKEREALILTAEARVDELEGELFQALLRKVAEQARPILRSVEAVADLDVLAALADVAADRSWCRPAFSDDDELTIVGGRHPVLEALLQGGEIVPNDCRLGGVVDEARGRLLIVTGPNMGGKSTYLRMVALCALLAQVGSFVPADAARIGLVDRLFTRVGSEDDLAAGASTFLVEMAETASILRQATSRSLVVLDEVGRGTSTHDGLCIAQAVLEHLHDAIGARTLFATHFHELTALADTLSSVRNVTVAVDERDGQLAFLYRVVPGAADRSYGVQVARLAGLLGTVTDRAALLLRERELGNGWPVDPAPLVLREDDLTPRPGSALTPRPPLPAAGEGEESGAASDAPPAQDAMPGPIVPWVDGATLAHHASADPAWPTDDVATMPALTGLALPADLDGQHQAPEEDRTAGFLLDDAQAPVVIPSGPDQPAPATDRPEGSHAGEHGSARSLDSARKLAPLGMTDGGGRLASLGMTAGDHSPAATATTAGNDARAVPAMTAGSDGLAAPVTQRGVPPASLEVTDGGATLDDSDLTDPFALPVPDFADRMVLRSSDRTNPDDTPPIGSLAPAISDAPTAAGYPLAGDEMLPFARAREKAVGIQGPHGTEGRESGGLPGRLAAAGEGDVERSSVGETALPSPDGANAVATRLLAEILALDLGALTPIRALTLLHELQTQAREAVPWSSWMASLAGGVPHIPPADKKTK